MNYTRKLCKKVRLKRWRRTLKVGYHNMVSNPRQHWRWASGMGGWKGKNHLMGIQPIRHQGEMRLELESILEAWRWHYAELAKDPTGNSQSPEKWLVDFPVEDDLDPLPGLNDLLTIEDVWQTLSRGKGNKSPGMDGIPLDFQMSALVEEARIREFHGRRGMNELRVDATGEVETEPDAPFTKVLLNMLQMVWTSGHIPKDWKDSIVVSVPKKGDLADMDNYRGISLMNTMLKHVSVSWLIRIRRTGRSWGWHAKIHMPWTERNAQGGVGVRDEQFTRRLARPRAAGANGHPGVNGDWTEVRPRNRTQDRKKEKKVCSVQRDE